MKRSESDLHSLLRRIDGRGYKAYQDIRGSYALAGLELSVDHVQGDPFAAPSRLSLRVDASRAGFPSRLFATRAGRTACADFLARQVDRAIRRHVRGRRGSGRSGEVSIDSGGQQVLERNCLSIAGGAQPEFLEARITAGLPAAGRRILGREAARILLDVLPRVARDSLFLGSIDEDALEAHVRSVDDQQAMREQLSSRGLVAFVAEGAVLPRRSGVDDRPLEGDQAVPFKSPESLLVELELPHAGPVSGMGIPQGVTLVAGGGFHGKSTLLRALERGVYNHLPGDGRERVATIAEAVKVRSEDGRRVENVDISAFINNLPLGRCTKGFSTENASGSTSQAANIIEALEVGARLLLIDEDTSATNFMIRDARMQQLVSKEREPITPFVDRVGDLYARLGVSTILVMGGSGDYFDRADLVLTMSEYRPSDATAEARAIVAKRPSQRRAEAPADLERPQSRRPRPQGFDASRGRREVKIDAKSRSEILFGTSPIDLSAVEQLVEASQTRAIGLALLWYARRCAPSGLPLKEGLQQLEQELDGRGLDLLCNSKMGNLARPRTFEIAAAINRLRTLQTDSAAGA